MEPTLWHFTVAKPQDYTGPLTDVEEWPLFQAIVPNIGDEGEMHFAVEYPRMSTFI